MDGQWPAWRWEKRAPLVSCQSVRVQFGTQQDGVVLSTVSVQQDCSAYGRGC